MAENTLALLQYLSSSESPLPSLTAGYSRPTTVYFQTFSRFWVYSFKTALTLYSLLFAASLVLVKATFVSPAPALKQAPGIIGDNFRGIVAVGSGMVGSLVGVNVVAHIMRSVLHKPLSWFSVELSCLALYGPAALAGAFISQIFVPRVREVTVMTSILLVQTLLACVIQYIGFGSSALFFLSGMPLFIALAVNALVTKPGQEVSLWAYAIGQFIPLTTGAQMLYGVLDVFVPLVSHIILL